MGKKIIGALLLAFCSQLFAQNTAEKTDLQPLKNTYVPKDRINSKEFQVSNKKIDKIHKVIDGYYDRKENLSDAAVIQKIEDEISRSITLTPSVKAIPMDLMTMQTKVNKKVNEQYPENDELIQKKAKEQFAKKYPIPVKNQKVTVNYRRGHAVYRYSGYFYGYGTGNSSILINSRHIAVFDLIQNDRIRFDIKYREMKQNEYVKEYVQNQNQEKILLSQRLFAAEKKKIHDANEKAGYILVVGGQYKTGKEIMKTYLDQKIIAAKKRDEYEKLKKKAEEQKNGTTMGTETEAAGQKKTSEEDEEDDEE